MVRMMCEKIISKGSAKNIDSCMIEELENIRENRRAFDKRFKMIMSCCGHGRYSRTLIVQNRGSGYHFEWYSGISLEGTKRSDSRVPFYKRDSLGHYYIPEVDPEVRKK